MRFLRSIAPLGYAIGCFINLGSDPVVLSMGWDNFSYALYDDPLVPETLMDIYTGWYARAVKHICKLGFDFVWAGDDIAFKTGPMISPGSSAPCSCPTGAVSPRRSRCRGSSTATATFCRCSTICSRWV